MLSRRLFLKNSGLAMFGVGAVPTWLSRAVYAQDAPALRPKVLIVIFQRGAVDGLNMVVPHGDPAYYAARPSIAIPRPDGSDQSTIDLDGHFGLHPSLRSLKPLWDGKQLAIVEAVGSPDPTRSHFDAQDYMESGTPGLKATADGWLNRALIRSQRRVGARAISFTPDVPRCLRGSNDVLAISSLNDFQIKDARLAASFEGMYTASADRILGESAKDTFQAVKLMQSIQNTPYTPGSRARYPNSRLGQTLLQIARVVKADVGLEVAFADTAGWDTHVNESGAQPHVGQLANLLRDFGDSLAAFNQDMGDRMAGVTIVTMSEFGRTVHENGNRGTDHGHANLMLILGGNVRGGHVYGEWPGLEREQLYEGRDLNVTTDFRNVLTELVSKQMGNHDLAHVFPGFRPVDNTQGLGVASLLKS